SSEHCANCSGAQTARRRPTSAKESVPSASTTACRSSTAPSASGRGQSRLMPPASRSAPGARATASAGGARRCRTSSWTRRCRGASGRPGLSSSPRTRLFACPASLKIQRWSGSAVTTRTELERGVGEVLIDEATLQARIAELGEEISAFYDRRDPLLVGVLKGAVFFMSDLMRHLTVPCEVDFMAISTYA